ncbi:MAG: Ig-like domain-containing protein, partial [Microbacteriaceae bacterium]
AWFGTDTFYYQVCDLNDPAQCDIAKVTITVPEGPAPMDPPTAVDDAETTPIDTAVEVDVLANDEGGTGDLVPSTVNVTSNPSHGTVSVNPATGKITYTPDAGYSGTDTFVYEVCNDNLPELCDTATVTITIEPADSPDVAPEATDDADSTPFETPIEVDVLHNDTPGSNPLNPGSVSIGTEPLHGTVDVDPLTGKITYTPADGFSGTDTFTYQVCDTSDPVLCTTAEVTVLVSPEQHEGDPAATYDEAETKLDTPVEIDVLKNDTPGAAPLDPASVKVTHDPEHGTVTIDPATGKITFTPTKGFSGEDTFTYEVCDTADPANCVSAVVTVVIKPDAKVAVDEVSTVDKQLVIDPTTLDPNAPEIDPTTVEIVDAPTHGTVEVDPVTGKITYTPAAGYKGTDSFTFRAQQRGNASAFVDYKYNLYLAGEESTSEVEKQLDDNSAELAFTGSEPWLPVAAGALLVAVGIVVRRRKA